MKGKRIFIVIFLFLVCTACLEIKHPTPDTISEYPNLKSVFTDAFGPGQEEGVYKESKGSFLTASVGIAPVYWPKRHVEFYNLNKAFCEKNNGTFGYRDNKTKLNKYDEKGYEIPIENNIALNVFKEKQPDYVFGQIKSRLEKKSPFFVVLSCAQNDKILFSATGGYKETVNVISTVHIYKYEYTGDNKMLGIGEFSSVSK